MPRQLFPTKPKPLPETTEEKNEQPVNTEEVKDSPSNTLQLVFNPNNTETKEQKPDVSPQIETEPEASPESGESPEDTPEKDEMPLEPNAENIVTVCGQRIEIKPTKVTYFRNKTATTYNLLKDYPLTELMTLKKGVVDEKRDGDQIIYDFMIACLDDKEFVRDHYNEMNADEIEQIVRIVGRLNHTDEKVEQLRKNREAQGSR